MHIIGLIVDTIQAPVEVPREADPLSTQRLLSSKVHNRLYRMAIKEVSGKCFEKAVTDPLQQQNAAISLFRESEKSASNKKRKRESNPVLTNPSTTIGCVVTVEVLNSLRVTHTSKADKKQREEDDVKNKLVKIGTDAFVNEQILTEFKLTYSNGLWRDFTLDKLKPLAKCCGVSVSINKQPMILAINMKMNALLI